MPSDNVRRVAVAEEFVRVRLVISLYVDAIAAIRLLDPVLAVMVSAAKQERKIRGVGTSAKARVYGDLLRIGVGHATILLSTLLGPKR